jgi:hypothetical protein
MFVTVVVVGNSAVTGQAHSGHIPSDVDVEVIGGSIADVGWVGLFTVQSSAPVTPGQEVTGMIEFVQDWSGTSSQSWEVAPATISPDFGQSDWNVTFAWWAVIPNFSSIIVGPDSTVGQGVDNGFVDVFWDSILLSFGGESINERDFGLGSVGSMDVLFVEVYKFGLRKSSELGNGSAIGKAGKSKSSGEFHTKRFF